MPSLDAAVRAALVTDAGVTRSGAIWAIQGSTLSISSDFGATWSTGSMPLPSLGTIAPTKFVLDASRAWSLTVPAGSPDADAGQGPAFDHVHLVVNRTSDGGRSWEQSSVPGDYPDMSRSLYFLDALHGFLMASGGRSNPGISTLLRTDDGGASWTVVRTIPATETGGASLGSEIVATDAETIWAAAEGEAGPVNHPILDVSRDGGLTWSAVTLPGIINRWGGPNNVPLGPPVFLDASMGFFALEPDEAVPGVTIFGTRDGGRTWTKASTLPLLLGTVRFVEARHWTALEQGLPSAVAVTDDGGATWSDITPAGLPAGFLAALDMLDTHDGMGVLFVSGDMLTENVLMLTRDGGRSWTPAAGLPNAAAAMPTPLPVASVTELPPVPPSPRPAVLPCGAADLKLDGGRMGGGTGTAHVDVWFANVGPDPCTLSGSPTLIQLLRADDSPLPTVAAAPAETPGPPVILPPGAADAASLAANWSNWCGGPPGPLHIRIVLPGGDAVSGPINGPPEYDYVPRCDAASSPSVLELLWSFEAPS